MLNRTVGTKSYTPSLRCLQFHTKHRQARSELRVELLLASPTPASAVDAGDNLAGSCQRTNARRQFAIGWWMLERSRAAVVANRWGALQMKIFSQIASRRNRRTIVAFF